MRLFLASQDFGRHVDRLVELVGKNNKALVVFNARDYETPEARAEVVTRKEELFKKASFEFNELDLREYFGEPAKLRKFINKFKPGVVSLIGGNSFLLRRALYQSGLDEILKADIYDNKYVYAGHSAGAIVAEPNLACYETGDEYVVPLSYNKGIVWGGLGFVQERTVPHCDSSNPRALSRQKTFRELDLPYITLSDSDVYVVDGLKKEVLR
ncbi:MAG: peptidase E [Candidatus Nomurabacteria bacterium]|jgi:dipeptidase E|nr:peptidase E [Candidatus Nomurabacteria bacterium]